MNLHEIYLAAQLAKNDNSGGNADLSEYYTKLQIDGLISSKVDKVTGKGLSTNDFTNAAKNKLDGLENYDDTDVKADVAELASQATINKSTLGYQRKNLLKLSATTQTKKGVTYTVNNGLINASGTTTGNSTYIVFEAEVPRIFDKDVIVTYTGEMTNTACCLRLGEAGSYSYPFVAGSGYRIPAGTKFSQVYLQQKNADVTVNVSDFGVMLRYAEITDDTYEPYRPSIDERLTALENAILGGNSND